MIRDITNSGNNSGNDSLKAKRCLFGPVDHEANKRVLKRELTRLEKESSDRWNFDFRAEKPLPGSYVWRKVGEKTPSPTDSLDEVCMTDESSFDKSEQLAKLVMMDLKENSENDWHSKLWDRLSPRSRPKSHSQIRYLDGHSDRENLSAFRVIDSASRPKSEPITTGGRGLSMSSSNSSNSGSSDRVAMCNIGNLTNNAMIRGGGGYEGCKSVSVGVQTNSASSPAGGKSGRNSPRAGPSSMGPSSGTSPGRVRIGDSLSGASANTKRPRYVPDYFQVKKQYAAAKNQ